MTGRSSSARRTEKTARSLSSAGAGVIYRITGATSRSFTGAAFYNLGYWDGTTWTGVGNASGTIREAASSPERPPGLAHRRAAAVAHDAIVRRMSRTLGAFCALLTATFGCSDGQETTVTVVEAETEQTSESEPSRPATEEGDVEVVTVRSNTQATIGDLRIGAGNIWEDTYETQAGNTATALGAGVSVFVRGDDSQNVRTRVHAGDTFDVAGRRIEIREITDEAVVLAIHP
jgi:hypothetical protein